MITIQNEINLLIKTNFIARNAFVITYSNVSSYNDNSDIANFQIIFSTNSNRSFVTLNYGACLKKFNDIIIKSEINCVNKNNYPIEKHIVNPCGSSNVNLPGKWIFDITNECK